MKLTLAAAIVAAMAVTALPVFARAATAVRRTPRPHITRLLTRRTKDARRPV
jgi:hypothetical protein